MAKTKDDAEAAGHILLLMRRVNLTGEEVPRYIQLVQWLEGIAAAASFVENEAADVDQALPKGE